MPAESAKVHRLMMSSSNVVYCTRMLKKTHASHIISVGLALASRGSNYIQYICSYLGIHDAEGPDGEPF